MTEAYYTVLRDGKEIKVDIPEGVLDKMSQDKLFKVNFLWTENTIPD